MRFLKILFLDKWIILDVVKTIEFIIMHTRNVCVFSIFNYFNDISVNWERILYKHLINFPIYGIRIFVHVSTLCRIFNFDSIKRFRSIQRLSSIKLSLSHIARMQ